MADLDLQIRRVGGNLDPGVKGVGGGGGGGDLKKFFFGPSGLSIVMDILCTV